MRSAARGDAPVSRKVILLTASRPGQAIASACARRSIVNRCLPSSHIYEITGERRVSKDDVHAASGRSVCEGAIHIARLKNSRRRIVAKPTMMEKHRSERCIMHARERVAF